TTSAPVIWSLFGGKKWNHTVTSSASAIPRALRIIALPTRELYQGKNKYSRKNVVEARAATTSAVSPHRNRNRSIIYLCLLCIARSSFPVKLFSLPRIRNFSATSCISSWSSRVFWSRSCADFKASSESSGLLRLRRRIIGCSFPGWAVASAGLEYGLDEGECGP